MKKTNTQIDQLAKLANLPLSKKEKLDFEKQLPDILEYVDEIQNLEIVDTPPTNQVTNKINELRKDKIKPSLSQTEALGQAKKTHNGFFLVPAILNE